MSLLTSIFTEFIENTWKAALIQMTDLFQFKFLFTLVTTRTKTRATIT
jgi:hypothetical protein